MPFSGLLLSVSRIDFYSDRAEMNRCTVVVEELSGVKLLGGRGLENDCPVSGQPNCSMTGRHARGRDAPLPDLVTYLLGGIVSHAGALNCRSGLSADLTSFPGISQFSKRHGQGRACSTNLGAPYPRGGNESHGGRHRSRIVEPDSLFAARFLLLLGERLGSRRASRPMAH